MGGGSSVKQTNAGQATQTLGGATSAATQAQNQGNTFSAQEQQLYNTLYGNPIAAGGVAGAKGALTDMLNPSSLNVTKPTGVYALQNTNADTAAAKQYAANAGNIKAAAAESGFNPATTPAGFVQDQLNQNSRALADTRGTNFSTATNQQYQDALANFWKAAGITGQGAATAGSQANQATGTAASTYGNLYGTAGHGNVTQNSNLLGNTIAAGGQIGAAAVCVAEDTLIRMSDGRWKAAGHVQLGDKVLGMGTEEQSVLAVKDGAAECFKVVTDKGHTLICTASHTLARPKHGYVRAGAAEGQHVLTMDGAARVDAVVEVGSCKIIMLQLDEQGSHTYLSDGIWSME